MVYHEPFMFFYHVIHISFMVLQYRQCNVIVIVLSKNISYSVQLKTWCWSVFISMPWQQYAFVDRE